MKRICQLVFLLLCFVSCTKIVPEKSLFEYLDIELVEHPKLNKHTTEYAYFGLIVKMNNGYSKKTTGWLNGAYGWYNFRIETLNAKYLGEGKAIIDTEEGSGFFNDYKVIVRVTHVKDPNLRKEFVINYPKPNRLIIQNGNEITVSQLESREINPIIKFEDGATVSVLKHPIYKKILSFQSEELNVDKGKLSVKKLEKPQSSANLVARLHLPEPLEANLNVNISYSQHVLIDSRRINGNQATRPREHLLYSFVSLVTLNPIEVKSRGVDSELHGTSARDVTLFITKMEGFDKIHKVNVKMEGEKYSFFIKRDSISRIQIEASGTNGSAGYPGANGISGCNEDSRHRATPGSNGWYGGNGGNGGDGGNIYVYYDDASKAVLPLISFNNKGGRGGPGGRGGYGGEGGRTAQGTREASGQDGRSGYSGTNGMNGTYIVIPMGSTEEMKELGVFDF